MKSKMIRFVGVVISLSMILSTIGCEKANKKEEEEITVVGIWEGDFHLGEVALREIEEEHEERATYYSALSDLKVKGIVEFDEEGNFTISFDKKSGDKYVKDAREVVSDGLKKLFEDRGVDIEESQDKTGIPWDVTVDCEIPYSAKPDMLKEKAKGKYRLEGDELYMEELEACMIVELEAKKMEWTEIVSDNQDIITAYPRVFYKQ